jgi:hypothetical protein
MSPRIAFLFSSIRARELTVQASYLMRVGRCEHVRCNEQCERRRGVQTVAIAATPNSHLKTLN